jgi:hypothetical protein
MDSIEWGTVQMQVAECSPCSLRLSNTIVAVNCPLEWALFYESVRTLEECSYVPKYAKEINAIGSDATVFIEIEYAAGQRPRHNAIAEGMQRSIGAREIFFGTWISPQCPVMVRSLSDRPTSSVSITVRRLVRNTSTGAISICGQDE